MKLASLNSSHLVLESGGEPSSKESERGRLPRSSHNNAKCSLQQGAEYHGREQRRLCRSKDLTATLPPLEPILEESNVVPPCATTVGDIVQLCSSLTRSNWPELLTSCRSVSMVFLHHET